jgi:serine/threonine protein kinase
MLTTDWLTYTSIGLITDGDRVVGFIITKISVKHPSLLPFVTGNLKSGISDPLLRRKWAAQVEHIVKELHRHGVVWGDAKPDNVVIDVDENAWVLDFGGGGTPGWMEPSMFQTREGDLHAVKRMRDGLWRREGAE